jgi:hypothetical protein
MFSNPADMIEPVQICNMSAINHHSIQLNLLVFVICETQQHI